MSEELKPCPTPQTGDALRELDRLKAWAMFEIEQFEDIRPIEVAYQTIRAALQQQSLATNVIQLQSVINQMVDAYQGGDYERLEALLEEQS